MKLNESGRQKLDRQQSCKQAQHEKLYSDLLQAQKEETFDSPGASTREDLQINSASAVPRPHHRVCTRDILVTGWLNW